MRKIVRVGGVAVALVVAACSGSEKLVDDSFEKDLEMAFTSSPIDLQKPAEAAQVVSSIERTAPPVRRTAPSQRVVKHAPAPRSTPAPVEVAVDVAAEPEPAPVVIAQAPVDGIIVAGPRPQPVESGGAGPMIDVYGGDGIGIGVVLRGGRAGIDHCDPRTDRRRGRGDQGVYIAINNRIPIVGTFPGSGRVTASVPR
ncbi:MAG: hypothetical protein ACSLFK_16435, partial [Gemmatimonadaceae bacterium]